MTIGVVGSCLLCRNTYRQILAAPALLAAAKEQLIYHAKPAKESSRGRMPGPFSFSFRADFILHEAKPFADQNADGPICSDSTRRKDSLPT
jgi:hypothetical protein